MAKSKPGSIILEPNKPDVYDGKRDFLAVHTWHFKIQQYLNLAALSSPNSELSDENRIMFASSFVTSTAAAWWHTIVQSGRTPSSWKNFRALVLNKFVPADHIRRACDRLRRLRQTASVSKYIAEFCNFILTINDMSEGELLDRFVQGLKQEIKLEVLKTQVSHFEDAAKIALRVDSALWSMNNIKSSLGSTAITVNDPMEIGNVQQRTTDGQRRQRAYDLKNNQCVICHTKNCRPWKCPKKGKVNNLTTDSDDILVDADSDNTDDDVSKN